jgi:hypothetical protein
METVSSGLISGKMPRAMKPDSAGVTVLNMLAYSRVKIRTL